VIHCDALGDQTLIDALRESVKGVAEKNGLRYFEAKRLLEIRPSTVLDKGRALDRLVQAHNLEAVLYIGNDMSDVDAFKTVQRMRSSGECYGVGVAVLNNWTPTQAEERADVMVQGTSGVEEVLDWLYQARKDWADRQESVM
jgi:trehalose 6-phosphate phosphatase